MVRKGNVRWDLSVPEDVDRHLRGHLARSGCSQKGGISEAVAEAVVEWLARHPLAEGQPKVAKRGIRLGARDDLGGQGMSRPVTPWDRAFMADVRFLANHGLTKGIREAAQTLLRACEEAAYHQVPFGPARANLDGERRAD